jgi:hypothetical protein
VLRTIDLIFEICAIFIREIPAAEASLVVDDE